MSANPTNDHARDATTGRERLDPGLTLVLAGTGKTGRRVAAGLTDLGVPVRIGTRSAETRFDWADPTTWPTALEGVRTVYLVYAPDVAIPRALEQVTALTTLAVDLGVQRIVLLSGRGEKRAQEAEQAVLSSRIPSASVVRASWFAQNFSEDFMADGVTEGALVLPETSVAEPFIDARDVADVAIAALTEPGHDRQVHEVTGPELLTMEQAAGILGEATGRPLAYVPVPIDAYLEGAAEQGVPAELRELIAFLFTEVFDGRNASTTDTVEQVLGRPARRFADFAREAAAAGAWSQVETAR